MPTKPKLHFARFEFKYILPKALRDEVESELGYFMDLDPFVSGRPDQRYFVRSLYFDDASYTAYYDKIDGLHTRYKFRIRTYADNDREPTVQFLEIKGRYNNLVFKHRIKLNDVRDPAESKSRRLVQRVLEQTRDNPVGRQFEYDLYRKRIAPRAVVDYFRRPYVSKYDPEFRITFDERLEGIQSTDLHPTNNARRRRILPGYTVVEIKFRYHIPSWFHRIIQSFELRRVSISKICSAVEALNLAANLS